MLPRRNWVSLKILGSLVTNYCISETIWFQEKSEDRSRDIASDESNRLFAGSHSRGIILNCNFRCLSCPSATFAHQHGGFVPREWLPAKSLFLSMHFSKALWFMNRMAELIEEISRRKHHSFDYTNMLSAHKVIIAEMYARPKKIKRLFLKSFN